MKRTEIIEILKQNNSMEVGINGPTAVFISEKCGKKTKTFSLSGDKEFITVTTEKYLFKHKYKIKRNEL